MAGKLRAKWPAREDLLSWWIMHKINNSPICELDDPDKIKEWLAEFHQLSMIGVHRILYQEYGDFRIEHVSPHYAGYAGTHT